MKKLMLAFAGMLFLQLSWSQEAQVRTVIDKMFQGLYTGDTSILRTCFVPGASLMTYEYDSRGNPRAKGNLLSDFLQSVAKMGAADMEEKLTGWQCLIDDGIASVWTPYEFYYEGKFSHCGVNSFQLMRVQGEWKITMITDTRRRKDCILDQEVVAEIDSLINLWHHAAATADEESFFGRMSADGIYIGTDATERWLRDELKTWSMKYFERESAWNFKPLSRNVRLGPGGQIAWFDELLDTWMGTCRSTGILEKRESEWRIVHYQLSVTLPNELMDGFRTLIGRDK
jgi:hypothetical protein